MPRPLSDWRVRVRRFFDQGPLDQCWPWRGAVSRDGYGTFRMGGRDAPKVTAHRAVYELLVGPVGAGLHLDHVCHNEDVACKGGPCPHRACVNPAHMEPVTSKANTLAGRAPSAANARKDECPSGHPYDVAYTTGGRTYRACRTCRNERRREARRL